MTELRLSAPYQTAYAIKTNCEHLVFLLCLKYGGYIKKSGGEADFFITARKTDNLYELCTAQGTYTTDRPLQEIDRIMFENTEYDDAVFALHGAAAEWGGKAYLFLASTSSGKTTLASYLASRGFGYITDDCILLDRRSFHIYPYNTPIHLRQGGLEALRRYNAAPQELEILEDVSMRRYIYTPANCVADRLPLGKIFFPERTERENLITDMSATERMTELLKAPITDYRVSGEYLKFISRLAGTNCKRLFYSDMEYVAEVIRNG